MRDFEDGYVQQVRSSILLRMRVRVLFFGVLKEAFGAESTTADLPEGMKVVDLLEIFGDRLYGKKELMESIAVAVNQEYAKADDVLHEGDEVALLPPVSGGVR